MSDTVTIPKAVLLGFVQSWGAELAFDLGERLTCAEVEDLAEILRALGYPVIADEWIDAHADGDDEGDSHYRAPAVDAHEPCDSAECPDCRDCQVCGKRIRACSCWGPYVEPDDTREE